MPIEFNCQSCSKLLRVPDGSGGKQCLCPACSTILNVPVQETQTPRTNPPQSKAPTDERTRNALCIPCPKCKHELICDPSLVGTKGQCRSCNHIFVINDFPTKETQAQQPAIGWVFSCPKCSQLFEGSEAMRGRRGKCHACGEVFPIELRIADHQPIEEKPKPTLKPNSFDDDLTLDVIPKESRSNSSARPNSQPPSKPTASRRKTTGTVVTKVKQENTPPIQFNCTSCKGRLEVPGAAALQLTSCPQCNAQLTVPSETEPMLEALAAADPWANLSPLGSAPASLPQSDPFGALSSYPAQMPMPSATSGVWRRSSDKSVFYITCGIFISICAFIALAVEIFYIVIATISFMLPNTERIVISSWLVTLSLLFVLSLLQFVGGIALARRRGVNMARTGAIICCLPCICILNIPFGIWGCILVFGEDAKREFR